MKHSSHGALYSRTTILVCFSILWVVSLLFLRRNWYGPIDEVRVWLLFGNVELSRRQLHLCLAVACAVLYVLPPVLVAAGVWFSIAFFQSWRTHPVAYFAAVLSALIPAATLIVSLAR